MGQARRAAAEATLMHDIVDLRSDTLTLPTPEMREAMARAEVGDDVWGEDPTVRRLEALAAQRLGKPAGPLGSPGTPGNLLSVGAPTPPGPGGAPAFDTPRVPKPDA